MPKKNVLIVATSRKTKGGITTVLKAFEKMPFWEKWNCLWLETHIDGNFYDKLIIAFSSYIKFLFLVPKYSIVHIHLSWKMSLFRKIPFIFTAKLFKKKVIIHVHASAKKTILSNHKNLYLKIFSKADAIVVLYKNYINSLDNNIKKKCFVIPNPCPSEICLKNRNPQNYILFAGTITKEKGVFDLIKAFSLIAKQYPYWKLIFAGSGDTKNCENLIEKLNLANQIKFKGWISGEAKNILFKNAGIFCLPSYTEGFPMAVLDAFAYGLPVVATPVGALKNVLVNESNSLIFNPGDINMLSIQLNRLISDLDFRKKISKESLILANNDFNVDKINNQICYLYKKNLNNP